MTLSVLADTPRVERAGSQSLRQRRSWLIKSLIRKIYEEKGSCRILDLGGKAAYWSAVGRKYLYDHGAQITLLNLEAEEVRPDPLFHSLGGDACATGFPDNAFDLVHSNSTIEHVGDWERMVAFAAETRRLAPAYYLQTPYVWFPVEPHFRLPIIHWLPEQVRARILLKRGGHDNFATAMERVQSARLLDRRQTKTLFPDAELVSERFYGLTKSIMAYRV
jgi:hypothetical protein